MPFSPEMPGYYRSRIPGCFKRPQQAQKEFTSFGGYIWWFVEGSPVMTTWRTLEEIPARTPLSALRCDAARI